MDIFIGNMPRNTSVLELRKLLGDAGRNARFRVFNRRSRDGRVSCFGHVVVHSPESAFETIRKLDGSRLNGSHLQARVYVHRSDSNERRARSRFLMPCSGVNRRRGERRIHF